MPISQNYKVIMMATNTMRWVKPLLILFMVFALCSTMASAATTIELIPSSKTVAQGETFTVDIKVIPGVPLKGLQADLSYDSDLLGSASATDGAMFDNFVPPTAGTGILNQISGYQMPAQGTVSTPGNLAAVQFTASSINAGETQLGLSNVKVKDENGNPLPAENVIVIGGTVIVTATHPPTANVTNPTSGTVSGTIVVTADANDDLDPAGSVTKVEFFLMPAETPIGTDANSAGGWSVQLDTTTFTDGDYQIKAVATDDEGATGKDTGSVFTIDNSCPCDFCLDLVAGWNLVSVPRLLDGPNDAATVFNLSDTELCEYYDGHNGRWSTENPKAMKVLPGLGYMVSKANAEMLCLNFDDRGTAIPPNQQLYKDNWNMIGFPSLGSMSVEEFRTVAALEGKFTMLWKWNNGWERVSPPDSNSMTPGTGYIIWMTEDGELPGMI